jgi:hypothetical protein
MDNSFMDNKGRWAELIEMIAIERDPEKVRLACAEIDRIAEKRELQASEGVQSHSKAVLLD